MPYPPLGPPRATGFHWPPLAVSGCNCSVKLWSRTPDGFALMAPEQPASVPTSTSAGTAGRAEAETRGVGTMWSVGQQRKGISRRGEHPRLACPGGVQPPRWWISGNTDAVWLSLEGGCPTDRYFHGLTEQLPADHGSAYDANPRAKLAGPSSTPPEQNPVEPNPPLVIVLDLEADHFSVCAAQTRPKLPCGRGRSHPNAAETRS